MKINKKLNLVMGLDDGDGGTFHVYSVPIAREVFERYYLPLSRVFTEIMTLNLLVIGPTVAYNMLRDVAMDLGTWDGETGVQNGLVNEIRRLTSIFMPTESGWQQVPLEVVISQEKIDDDDLALILGSLVFFTAVSYIPAKSERVNLMNGAAAMWGTLTTSSSITEYANSLPTLKPIDSTGETPTTAFVPS
jgi:hypothetical protein